MFRYLALIWDAEDLEAAERKKMLVERLGTNGIWAAMVRKPGLELYEAGLHTTSNEVYLIGDPGAPAGAVLGKLFVRHPDGASSQAPACLDEKTSVRVLESDGRFLVEHFWGRYVAFARSPAPRRTWVLRDPTGAMPCYFTQAGSVSVYFSWVEDALALGLGPFSIDWEYIAAHLAYHRLEVRRTGLREVSNVLGGECVAHTGSNTRRQFHWNALHISQSDLIEDPAEAIAVLRRVTLDCVRTWAQCHSRIVLTLSGGLDSSVVLACQPESVTCVNYHSPGSDSDERAFARLSARKAGCELVEVPRDPSLGFDALVTMPRSAAPLNYRYYLESSRLEADFARARNASAVYSGEGGDQIFYQSRASFAVLDYFQRHGLLRSLSPKLFEIALASARMDRFSVFLVLRRAVAAYLKRHRWSPVQKLENLKGLLQPEAIGNVRKDLAWIHPVIAADGRMSSGKCWHAYQLSIPVAEFYDPLIPDRMVERVAPLFSQPLIEACLRMPIEVLTLGGWDRCIARRAFEQDLPQEIVTRRSKGGVSDYGKAMLERNSGFIREILFDGLLIRQGILDRARLSEVFEDSVTRASSDREIYDCVNVEAWLQRWS